MSDSRKKVLPLHPFIALPASDETHIQSTYNLSADRLLRPSRNAPAASVPCPGYFPEKGDAATKGKLWYQWGYISLTHGDYDKAVISFEKGLEQARITGDYHLEGLICRAMADTYNRTYNTREDTVYLRRAWLAFGAEKDTLYQTETALRLVAAFMNDREWEKAGALLDQVTPIATRHRALFSHPQRQIHGAEVGGSRRKNA